MKDKFFQKKNMKDKLFKKMLKEKIILDEKTLHQKSISFYIKV